MTWLGKFKTRRDQDTAVPVHEKDPEVLFAFEKAKAALSQAHESKGAFREVTADLDRINYRNHFGESIEICMQRREKLT